MNVVCRKHKFDLGHRLINYDGPCKHPHGHEYHIEIFCSYKETDSIGIGIDFSEIKKKVGTWIDASLDHGFACSPFDKSMISFLYEEKAKYFITKLGNPTAENLSKEIFYVATKLLNKTGLKVVRIKLYETINCYVETTRLSKDELDIFSEFYEDVSN